MKIARLYVANIIKRFSRYIDNDERNNIINNQQFSCRVLCATTALDNGVNIKDDAVKHIILDVVTPVSTLQCMGRKRLKENETVNIYIRELDGRIIWGLNKSASDAIQPAIDYQRMSTSKFAVKYSKKAIGDTLDLISSEKDEYFKYRVNQCVFEKYRYDLDFYYFCREYMTDYIVALFHEMHIPFELVKSMTEYDEDALNFFISYWEGKRIFSNEQDIFIDKFYEILGIHIDKRLKGYNKMNDILTFHKIPYYVESKKNTIRDKNRNKMYWLLNKK